MIKDFFNEMAPKWDTICSHNERNIRDLLKFADISYKDTVLDVGCGTGVLEQFIQEYSPRKITAVDFSTKMIEQARLKYRSRSIVFKCMDVMELENVTFDRIVMYNVFPHFPNPSVVLEKAASLLNMGGRILICHGDSRNMINQCHGGMRQGISNPLPPACELRQMMSDYFRVDITLDTDRMYAVSGTL